MTRIQNLPASGSDLYSNPMACDNALKEWFQHKSAAMLQSTYQLCTLVLEKFLLDRDTALTVPVVLALQLESQQVNEP